MQKLLTIDRVAPELKSGWPNRILLALAVTLVGTLALGGAVLGYYYKHSRSSISLDQLEYHSTEVFGTAPGARLFYYPKTHEIVMRGWILGPLRDGSTYELWAGRNGSFTWLATGRADDFVGFTFVGHGFLSGVDTILLTVEPPGSAKTAPNPEPLVVLVR